MEKATTQLNQAELNEIRLAFSSYILVLMGEYEYRASEGPEAKTANDKWIG